MGHFRKLYLRLCEMRKLLQKLPLVEVTFLKGRTGISRNQFDFRHGKFRFTREPTTRTTCKAIEVMADEFDSDLLGWIEDHR